MPTINIPDKICPHCGGTRWYKFLQNGYSKYYCKKKKDIYLKDWHNENPNKHKSYRKPFGINKSRKLTDTYLKELLIQYTNLSFKDIPKKLIETKRKQLLLTRQIKNYVKSN